MSEFKIRVRERVQATPPPGHRQSWTEYQVVEGRKVVFRGGVRSEAEKWIAEQGGSQ